MSNNHPHYEYIIIPSDSVSETNFFLDLLKKMKKKAATLSNEDIEDVAFIKALNESKKSPKGSLSKTKAHLSNLAKMK